MSLTSYASIHITTRPSKEKAIVTSLKLFKLLVIKITKFYAKRALFISKSNCFINNLYYLFFNQ